MAWDVLGEQGHPIRTTVSEMGPLLLANLLELNDTQEGVLNIAFRVADNEGLLLLDLEDLQQMLRHVGERRSELSLHYGNISTASVAAILRRLLVLEDQGAAAFLRRTGPAAGRPDGPQNGWAGPHQRAGGRPLIQRPRLYSTILLWLLAELFEELPESGQPGPPGTGVLL